MLLYGFDDLSREQIELRRRARRAPAEVTVAIAWEDRPALAARAELLGVLRDELGGRVVAELDAGRRYTDERDAVRDLERNLFEPEPETTPVGRLAAAARVGRRARRGGADRPPDRRG